MDEAGKLKAVLLRYYNSYVPHVQDGFAVEGVAALIQQTSTLPLTLSGKTAIVRRFEQWLPLGKSVLVYNNPQKTSWLSFRTWTNEEKGGLTSKRKVSPPSIILLPVRSVWRDAANMLVAFLPARFCLIVNELFLVDQ
ncbi:hypothetical protein ABEV38_13655 [Parageobacillus thermoglucosidasius]|uniref:hypothetical protein n=1 Tax=Parageobacillus thermoglucosidasius TaxID=1426 RepID=UPI003D293CE9